MQGMPNMQGAPDMQGMPDMNGETTDNSQIQLQMASQDVQTQNSMQPPQGGTPDLNESTSGISEGISADEVVMLTLCIVVLIAGVTVVFIYRKRV